MNANTKPKKVIIVGGVAGGASCATRLRRLDETAEILMIDRGPHVSFANCGLPYHVGNVIPDEAKLLVAKPEMFRDRFRVDVRTRHEAVSIDREKKEVEIRDLESGKTFRERYDALVLSPGASPIRPPLPGIDLEGIYVVRTIPDAREIRDRIERGGAKRAVVVGGGFIGLEMAENLVHRGLEVTIVEMLDQVMPPLDPDMARLVAKELEARGVRLALGDGVAGFEPMPGGGIAVRTQSGASHPADLVILSIGVRPESGLAKAAGLEIGQRGGIRVDGEMRTSDPSIYAVGDAVEVRDPVTGAQTLIPLGGPANRQGRVAADAICGRPAHFRGVQGTAVCGVFGVAVAATGASEKALARAGAKDYAAVILHPNQHSGYYPGASPITMKLVFRKNDGLILGAQAVGVEGAEKRIDVIAMAMQLGGTVFDLEEAELCYAPQFGSAKDPVNMAGMIAANFLRGDHPLARWEEVGAPGGEGGPFLLDVRDPDEFAEGHAAGAVNIPLASLRGRLADLPEDREIWVYCASGARAYNALRILLQKGFRAKNLSGGFRSFPPGAPSEKP
jgi:NADPH-dependent 2,4-dienoyl-CoA reductase/sulfur reductase-like enzyme/rhodanese-related sulfurtransferase